MVKSGTQTLIVVFLLTISCAAMLNCPPNFVLKGTECLQCAQLPHTVITNNLLQRPNSCQCAQSYKWCKKLLECFKTDDLNTFPSVAETIASSDDATDIQEQAASARLLQTTCDTANGFIWKNNQCINCRLIPFSTGIAFNNQACVCQDPYTWSNTFRICQCNQYSTQNLYIQDGVCTPCGVVSDNTTRGQCPTCRGGPFGYALIGCLNCTAIPFGTGATPGAGNASGLCDCSFGYIFNQQLARCICDINGSAVVNGTCTYCAYLIDTALIADCTACNGNFFFDNYQCKLITTDPNAVANNCSTGFTRQGDPITNKTSCLCSLNSGYFLSGPTCNLCTGVSGGILTVAGCQNCSQNEGYFLNGPTCIYCPRVLSSTGIATNSGCVCEANFFWNTLTGTCQCDWLKGFTNNQGVCMDCGLKPNSALPANLFGCGCAPGYRWDNTSLLCVCDTNRGSFLTGSNGCFSCFIRGSTGTTNGTSCVCVAGFVWDPLQLICVCDSKQNFFQFSNGICYECSTVRRSNGLATPQGCGCTSGLTWIPSTNECGCPAGFVNMGNTCLNCSAAILSLNNTNLTGCNACSNSQGFFLSSSGVCIACAKQFQTSGTATVDGCDCRNVTQTWVSEMNSCVCDFLNAAAFTRVTNGSLSCQACTGTCSCGRVGDNSVYTSLTSFNGFCTLCAGIAGATGIQVNGSCECYPGNRWSKVRYPYQCACSWEAGSYLNGSVCTNCSTLLASMSPQTSGGCALCDPAEGFLYLKFNDSCILCSSILNTNGQATPFGCGCQTGVWDPNQLSCVVVNNCSVLNCLNCASPTTCGVCQGGFIISANASVCLFNCNITKCSFCNTNSTCSKCSIGFALANNGTTCVVTCNITNCQSCNSSLTCQNCLAGYQLAGNVCQINCSISNCTTCSAPGNCSLCAQGFIPVFNTTLNQSQCVPAPCNISGCIACNNTTTCTTCVFPRIVNINNGSQCIFVCNIPNCAVCLTNTTCSSCNSSLTLATNASLCFFNCSITNCSSCNSSTSCSACGPGLTLATNGSKCFFNCSVANCAVCNSSTTCSLCNTNLYRNANNTQCNYNCSIPNCQSCNNTQVCGACLPGSILFNNTCTFNCSINSCGFCNSTNTCSNCTGGLLLNANATSCVFNCSIPFCATCNATNVCSGCLTGSVLAANNTCSFNCSISNCLTCNSTTSCSVCGGNMTVSPNASQCIFTCPSVPNCAICNSTTTCSACNNLTFLSANTCLFNCSIANCSFCNSTTTCSSCTTGFIPASTGSQCLFNCNITGCLNCASMTTCSSCAPGRIINTNSTLCPWNCGILSCTTCNTSTTCLVCATDMVLANSSTRCIFSCVISRCFSCASNTTCLSCLPGYGLNAGATACLIQCSVVNCATCLNATACTTCATGYTLSTSGNCQLVCPPGNINIGNATNISCYDCRTLSPLCLACGPVTGGYSCSSCPPIAFISAANTLNNTCTWCNTTLAKCLECSSSSTCTLCAYPYSLLGNGTCSNVTCLVLGCSVCDTANSSLCTTCLTGFNWNTTTKKCDPPVCSNGQLLTAGSCGCSKMSFLTTQNGITFCKACPLYCAVCSNLGCTTCLNGYYLNYAQTCVPCATNCAICTATACTQCLQGFSPQTDGSCQSLGGGTNCASVNGKFVPCPPGCASCTSGSTGSVVCTTPKEGYSVTGGVASQCDPSCLSCVPGSTACASCFNNKVLVGGNCVPCSDPNAVTCYSTNLNLSSSCAPKYSAAVSTNSTGGFCKPCASNCIKCDVSGPGNCDSAQCVRGFVQLTGTTNCTACFNSCPVCDTTNLGTCLDCGASRYTDNTTGTCKSCPVSCKACTSASVCSSCQLGYTLIVSTCITNLPYPCATTTSATVCGSCMVGYTLSSGTCVLSISSCNNSCTTCPYGYYLSSGNCLVCSVIANCLTCSSTNSTVCSQCKTGYYLINSSCTACSSNCADCSTSSFCSTAASGYYLVSNTDGSNSGSVSVCGSFCLTCSGNSDYCLSCISGYTISGSVCFSNAVVNIQLLLGPSTGNNSIFSENDTDADKLTKTLSAAPRLFTALCNKIPYSLKKTDTTCQNILKFTKMKIGSIIVVSTVSAVAATDSSSAISAVSASLATGIDGATILQSSISTENVSSGSSSSNDNLPLILGLSIGLSLFVIIVVIVVIGLVAYKRKKAMSAVQAEPELLEENTLEKLNKLPTGGSSKKLPKINPATTEPVNSDNKLEIVPDFSKANINDTPAVFQPNKASNNHLHVEMAGSNNDINQLDH